MSLPSFIPQFVSESANTTLLSVIRVLNTVQTQLNTIFTSLTKKVQLDSILLQKVQLQMGSNQVQTTLGRTLTGWTITRQRSAASIYDQQDQNTIPGTYLVLISSAPVSVDILVF